MQAKIRVRELVEGEAEGELLVHPHPISFLGEVDPKSGSLTTTGEKKLVGKILVFPYMRGSTVGSYVIYALRYYGNAPFAMVVERADPILVAGCALARIPLYVFEERINYSELRHYRKGRLSGSFLSLQRT